jgi:hypothetical protein
MELTEVRRLAQHKRETQLYKILNSSHMGLPKNSVIEVKEEFANRKPEQGMHYFYYSGPLDDKTREFCKLMLNIDKVFSEEEINKISEELNYDVLKYEGSYNCRHKWVRFRGKIISTPSPTMREIRKLINNGIEG